MPAEPTALSNGAVPGWYPDPLGPSPQLRWWDGRAWSSDVRTPAPPAGAPADPGPSAPRRRPRRVVAWGALGAFSLGVTGVVIAVNRGQDVCEVSATGIKFCEGDDDAREQVAEEQPELASQAGELAAEAQEGATPTSPGLADLTGTWLGDNGFVYVIQQFGSEAVLSEIAPDGLTTAVGSGLVEGAEYVFDVQDFLGNVGTGSLRLDGNTLSGTFESFATGTSIPVVMRR